MKYLQILILAFWGSAGGHWVDSDTSGNWFNPDQSGHGVQIEVLDGSEAVVAWYTFDPDGQPLWLIGLGRIEGNEISVELSRLEGPGFPPDFDPEALVIDQWGTVRFTQIDCDSARLDWQANSLEFADGSLDLVRLTRLDDSTCRAAQDFGMELRFNLDGNRQQFDALFLDYPQGEEELFELDWGHEALPGAWSDRSGVRISGANRSDDLLMLLMRPIDGLKPSTEYHLELEMQVASNVPSGCIGIGGAPGEAVTLKLGAHGEQPDFILEESSLPDRPPMRRASFDLGQQSQPGEFSRVVGDLANGLDGVEGDLCIQPDRPWVMLRVSTAGQPYTATTDADGRLWVYGFSDSGFEGTSTWYLTEFIVRLERAEIPPFFDP